MIVEILEKFIFLDLNSSSWTMFHHLWLVFQFDILAIIKTQTSDDNMDIAFNLFHIVLQYNKQYALWDLAPFIEK